MCVREQVMFMEKEQHERLCERDKWNVVSIRDRAIMVGGMDL